MKVNVANQKEGPRFHPDVKVVTLSEDHSSIDLTKIITNYAAIDTDTQQTVTNVRYSGFLKNGSLSLTVFHLCEQPLIIYVSSHPWIEGMPNFAMMTTGC